MDFYLFNTNTKKNNVGVYYVTEMALERSRREFQHKMLHKFLELHLFY